MGVISRFFILKKEHVYDKHIALMSDDGDFLPITDLKTFHPCGKFIHESQGYIIVKVALPGYMIQLLQNALEEGVSPLSLPAVVSLGITQIYGGANSLELFQIIQQRFGMDLSGEYDTGGVDDNGQTIMAPYVIRVTIAGE